MDRKLSDIPAGTKFGRLTVVERAEDYIDPRGQHVKRYLCKCSCGVDYITRGSWLKSGKSTCCTECSRRESKEKRIRDLTNQRFGRWTVLGRADSKKRGVYWKCRCDCGTEKIIRGTSLTTGNSISCGCFALEKLREDRLLNLVGKKFGHLTVISQTEDFVSQVNGKHRSRWKCLCDCGNTVFVNGSDLTSGNTYSCGCYKLERTSETHFQDLTGQRFGMLKVLKRVEDYINTDNGRARPQFLCQCDCGNQKIVQKESLMNGTISCGCIKSRGEREIAEYLRKYGVCFEVQYGFPDLNGGLPLKFDFAVFNKESKLVALIEYQGEQHYKSISFFGGQQKFEKQKENDATKREYCKKNGLKLIEIPYWENIENQLTDLLLMI